MAVQKVESRVALRVELRAGLWAALSDESWAEPRVVHLVYLWVDSLAAWTDKRLATAMVVR